jgi:transcriptional regulator with XRE-family HTH domain
MGGIIGSEEVGRRIRQFRQDAGLSQEALAELVGVSFQQIQKYESGHTTLNILKLQNIADALKLSVTEFFSSTATQHVRLSCDETQLLQAYRRIKNGEMRSCVLKLVNNVNKRVK